MKRYVKLILIVLVLFSCSGCVKYNEEMKISIFKSAKIKVIYAVDKDIVDRDILTKKEKKILKNNGYQLKEYKDKNYKGYIVTYKVKNIDKVNTNEENFYYINSIRNNKPTKMFKVKKSWFKNKYEANFRFDASDVGIFTVEDDQDEIEYLCDDGSIVTYSKDSTDIRVDCHRVSDYELKNAKSKNPLSEEELNKKLNKNNDLRFTVKVSGKVLENNASKKSGNKLTWKLNDKGLTDIKFDFYLYNYFNIFITIIGVLIIVIGILFVSKKVFKKRKKRRRKK